MFKHFIKYSIVSFFIYAFTIGGTYFLVEKVGLLSQISYLIIVTMQYIATYIANTKFVFLVEFSKEKVIKYILYLIIMWLFSNLVFNVLVECFNINYLIAIIFNLFILGLFKFFIQRKYIFTK